MNYFVDVESIFSELNNPIWSPLQSSHPSITGNVQISCTNENIFLDSIDANNEMSSFTYKKYNPTSTFGYFMDLALYLKPLRANFASFYEYKYPEQYKWGSRSVESNLYTENYSFFAPLYLGFNEYSTLPEFFTVLRVPKEISTALQENYLAFGSILQTAISQGIPVKTFDLRYGTIPGNYIKVLNQWNLNNAYVNTLNSASQVKAGFAARIIGGNLPYNSPQGNQFDIESIEYAGALLGVGIQGSKIYPQQRSLFLSEIGLTPEQIQQKYNQALLSNWQKLSMISSRFVNLNFLFSDSPLTEDEDYFGFYSSSEYSYIPYRKSFFVNSSLQVDIDATNRFLEEKIDLQNFNELPSGKFIVKNQNDSYQLIAKREKVEDKNERLSTLLSKSFDIFRGTADIFVSVATSENIDVNNLPVNSEGFISLDGFPLENGSLFLLYNQPTSLKNGIYEVTDSSFRKAKLYSRFRREIPASFTMYSLFGVTNFSTLWEIANPSKKRFFSLSSDEIIFQKKAQYLSYYGVLDRNSLQTFFSDAIEVQENNELLLKFYEKSIDLSRFLGDNRESNSLQSQVRVREHKENILVSLSLPKGKTLRNGDKLSIENRNINRDGQYRWTCVASEASTQDCYIPFFFHPPQYKISVYDYKIRRGTIDIFELSCKIHGLLLQEIETGQNWKISYTRNGKKFEEIFLVENYEVSYDDNFTNILFLDTARIFGDTYEDLEDIIIESQIVPEWRVYFSTQGNLADNLQKGFDSFSNITVDTIPIDDDNLLCISKNSGRNNLRFFFSFVKSKNPTYSILFNGISAVKKFQVKDTVSDYSSVLQGFQDFIHLQENSYKSRFDVVKPRDSENSTIINSGLSANWKIRQVKISNASEQFYSAYDSSFEWMSNYPLVFRLENIPQITAEKILAQNYIYAEIFPNSDSNLYIKRVFKPSKNEKRGSFYDIEFSDLTSSVQNRIVTGNELFVTDQSISPLRKFTIQGSEQFSLPTIEFKNGFLDQVKIKESQSYFIDDLTYNVVKDYDEQIAYKKPFRLNISRFTIYPLNNVWNL